MTNQKQEALPRPELLPIKIISENDWREFAEVLKVLRPKLNVADLLKRRETLSAEGYQALGLKQNDKLLAVASYTISPHVMHGRELLIHDLATRLEDQRKGFAKNLIHHIAEIAKAENCFRVFVHSKSAQEFYISCGYHEYSVGLVSFVEKGV